MTNSKECRKLAKRNLSERRFAHTEGVARLARQLAKQYGADVEKAEIAAYLHDICKEKSKEELLQTLRENVIITRNAEKRPVGIWHAAAAMVYAKESLGIEDEEILNAIRYHTSGRAEMSLLEKIIYMADMCSEERDYSEVGELRALLRSDLDKALIKALSYSIRWLKEDQRDIDEDSIAALHFMSERYSARG